MRHFLSAAAIALSLLAWPAQAATFEWWKNEPDSYGLKISGVIGKGDADQFRRTLLDADPYYGSGATFTIYLESPGGLAVDAIGIGRTVRLNGFNTFVADGAYCASGCGLVWLAGSVATSGPMPRSASTPPTIRRPGRYQRRPWRS